MIYRLPCNEFLKPYVDRLVTLCMKLIETDNEQNGISCIRIIVELQKNFRPPYNAEVSKNINYLIIYKKKYQMFLFLYF